MSVINEKGGLQAAQAIASSIKTLLGPYKSAKCCINGEDDSDAIICSNTAKILQYLEVEHPVGYIINDACQSMYKTHGCGCKTLVCMIGFWSRAAEALQHEGVPVSIISQLFDEVLCKCLQVLEEIALPIQEALKRSKLGVIQEPLNAQGLPTDNPCSTLSSSSMFLFEKVWSTSVDGMNKLNTTHIKDCALLNPEESGMSNDRSIVHATGRQTLNLAEKEKFEAASQDVSNNEGIFFKESSTLGSEEVDDEFDSCFDCPAANAIEMSDRKLLRQRNKVKENKSWPSHASKRQNFLGENKRSVIDKFDVCSDRYMNGALVRGTVSENASRSSSFTREVDLTNRSWSKIKKQKGTMSVHTVELAKTNQMLKNLGISGHSLESKKSSTVRNVSEILKSCRNFSVDSPKTPVEENVSQAQEDSDQEDLDIGKKENLEALGEMLCHGKDNEMRLAVEVVFNQISGNGKKTSLNTIEVDKNAINIERIVGPTSDHSQVVCGILLRQKAENLGHFPPASVHVALVNGDITEDFRHVGFKDSFHTRRVFNEESYIRLHSNADSWLQKILNVLRRLNIGAVFAMGKIDKDLEDCCHGLKIHTFSSISSKVLQLLSYLLGSTAVVYLSDLRESHVGRPAFLHQWKGLQHGTTDAVYYILKLGENQISTQPLLHTERFRDKGEKCKEYNGLLQTVLLCGSSVQLLVDLELAFWNCVFRLRNTINCGRVLPGAGRTELACIRKIRDLSENPDIESKPTKSSSWIKANLSCYRTAVYTAFADGLVEFLISVLSNSGQVINYGQAHAAVQKILNDHNQSCKGGINPLVADDFTAKKNAWCRALGVVRLVLQADMNIIAGTQHGS